MKITTAQQAEAQFYAAFEHADLEAMMALWVHDESAFCVHPGGGRVSGLAEVRGAWRSIFREGPTLRFDLVEVQRFTLPTVAVHTLYEHITVRGEDGPPHVVMATNIYVLTAEGWRVLGHHGSPLPRLAPRSAPRDPRLH